MSKTKQKEKRQNWYFTFGSGQAHDNCYITFFGTWEETRKRMFDAFDAKWSMQYSEEQWNNPGKDGKKFNGFKPTDKVTIAQVWGLKEIH